MTAARIRFIAYMASIGLGLFMAVYGVIVGEPATLTAGLALITTGTMAGLNTPVRTGDHGS